MAGLLGQEGLKVLVLDREAAIYPLPRAIHFDGEVMRIFQSLGLKNKVLEISRPGIHGMHFLNAEEKPCWFVRAVPGMDLMGVPITIIFINLIWKSCCGKKWPVIQM